MLVLRLDKAILVLILTFPQPFSLDSQTLQLLFELL